MEEEKYKIEYFDKLYKLYSLYESVKKSIILAENFDETREMYIAPFNQLRSALDHIFKSICIAQEMDKCDYELKEAKEHLERAGYDALELLAGNIGKVIIDKLTPYDNETLTTVFPSYFTDIKPRITEVRKSVAERRMERKIDSDESFFAYFQDILDVLNINKEVDNRIPALQEYKKKKKTANRIERWWKYLIGPIIGFGIGLLTLFFKK